jgi:ribonuclease HII
VSSVSPKPALDILQRLARDARDPHAIAVLLRSLRGDARVGAVSLTALLTRRLSEQRSERLRVARLFALRRSLARAGVLHVAGVDEVGVGPLAGPVVAAAVILRAHIALPGLDDSKQLTAPARERLDVAIRAQSVAIGVGEVWPPELDRLNVYHAALEAMRRAVIALSPQPDHVLVDARTIPGIATPQTALVHGDARDGSIAAASIVAKVHRDAIMARLERVHPGYGFARHMGYPTPEHLDALRRLGPSPLHRMSFAPCNQFSLL